MREKEARIKVDLELGKEVNQETFSYPNEQHKEASSLTFKGSALEMDFVLTIKMDPSKLQAFKELVGFKAKFRSITIKICQCEQKKITDYKDQDQLEETRPDSIEDEPADLSGEV
jgi:hypothetical protein